MKTERERYNERAAKHEAIETLARQLEGGGNFPQSMRRCRSAAKQMLQGRPRRVADLVDRVRALFAEARA